MPFFFHPQLALASHTHKGPSLSPLSPFLLWEIREYAKGIGGDLYCYAVPFEITPEIIANSGSRLDFLRGSG